MIISVYYNCKQEKETSAIKFLNGEEIFSSFDLGWCPENAYLNMIKDVIENLNNDTFQFYLAF